MLSRFKHILVPVDFTEKNKAALDIAFDIAVQNKSRVTLLHVIESLGFDDSDVRDFYARLQQRAETELESLSQRFTEAGVPIDWKLRLGKRAAEIISFSETGGVDLIVMHSHRIDPDHATSSIGTLSYQVSIFCACPVLLVK